MSHGVEPIMETVGHIVGCKNYFALLIKSEKQKHSGSVVPRSFKNFQNTFEWISRVYTYHIMLLISQIRSANYKYDSRYLQRRVIGILLADRVDHRALLAKSLPNRPLHKGCMWVHESRADLEPLRFSTHERSGVGSERVLRENDSLAFLSYFSLREFRPRDFYFLPWGWFSRIIQLKIAGHLGLGILK